MKKKFRKFAALILAVAMLTTSSFAIIPGEDAMQPGMISLGEYSTDTFRMAFFQDGNQFYTISLLNDGRIEFVTMEIDGQVTSLWLAVQDVAVPPAGNILSLMDDENFIDAVMAYSSVRASQAAPVNVTVAERGDVQPSSLDLDYLLNEMAAIHGSQHTWANWTSFNTYSEGGLTYQFKEDLMYGMQYRQNFGYETGSTISSLASFLFSASSFLQAQYTLAMLNSVLADVFMVVDTINYFLDRAGVISTYYGDASYTRYVMVENGGPYYETYKLHEYVGWVDQNNREAPLLDERLVTYQHTEAIFESYELQRQRAYENYIAQN